MRSIVPCLLFLTALSGCGTSDPIVFGHVDAKDSDDAEYHALKLAVDATNEDPAKRPFERRVHIIHAGAGRTAEQFRAQAVRLAAVDRVFALIGGHNATEAELIGQAAQADDRLAITMSGWAGAPPIGNLFPIGLSAREQGRCLAQYVSDNLKLKRVAVLIDESAPFPVAAARAFTNKLGSAVTFSAVLPRPAKGSSDAEPAEHVELRDRLRKSKPDAILLAMPAEKAISWAKKLVVANDGKVEPLRSTWLFAGEEGDVPTLLRQPELTSGWIAGSSFAPGEDGESFKLFADSYRKKYQREPDMPAALAYDAYQVLVQACKRASDATTAKVRDELRKKDATFDVLTGKLTFARDQTARRVVYVVRIQQDGLHHLQRYEPAADAVPTAK